MTTENRSTELAPVRAMVGAIQAQCDNLRESWPYRYPVPPAVDAAFNLEALVIAQARGGDLKRATAILTG